MDKVKNNLLDLVVTIIIIVAIYGKISGLKTLIQWYTPILLILKVIAVVNRDIISIAKIRTDRGTVSLTYLLYGLDILFLGIAGWWWTSAQWVLIGILSGISLKQVQAKPATRKTGN